ncbi:related to YPK9-vacuolar protein with a possible role in sequestering heavy metals [Sporisorium reilianum f. sp. reilianum]|uniref:Cation-transporting ATPase n=1 Tax=Sporisorium reilianum f. sp. reilianum TaxID=72559 RepID=A0A2N8ULH7_9BASI|nr:related to YPK9-vacuolar protein with a possible role in sequestering heavy metals [Sporisorium reilianum f. sp. reilianum]
MTHPDRSRRNGSGGQPSKQPFEVAADEYQAPFQLPAKKIAAEPSQPSQDADLTAFASSPYFDDQEAREAIEWAQSQRDAEIDSSNAANADGGVEIGGRRRRRDSQVGSYDEGGSIFDGPGAGAVPSSVSSMRHEMARPELGRRTSRSSRRRISMEGRSPRRTRKLSSASAQSEAITVSSERSVSPDSVAGRRKPASQRSGSTYHFGRRKRVPEDADLTGSSQPKGMLGSILASIRGDRGDDDNDDARSRRSFSRPLLSRRRSSGSVVSSRAGRSDAGRDEEEDEDEDYDNTRGWSDDDYGFDDEDDDDSYHSSDDDASNRNGILPSAFGTLSGAVDPVFGDTRFLTDHPPEDELDAELAGRDLEQGELSGFGRSDGDLRSNGHLRTQASNATTAQARKELSFLDKSSKSRQQVYLTEEDTLIRFTGYKTLVGNQIIYSIVCCLTLGIVYLIGRWLPRFRLKYVCKEVEFEKAEFIMIENQWGDLHKEKLTTIPFARPLATVFPHSSREPPSTQAESQSMPTMNLPPELVNKSNAPSKAASARSSIVNGGGGAAANGTSNGNGGEISATGGPPMLSGVQTEQLMDLTFLDYRYTRYALHPPTGRLRMVKDWRDPLWTSLGAISGGISWDAEKDRTTIFGRNAIEIQAKSTWQLLVDEVLHPFYMFQIVSIILWSFDNYYYYAFCIAVISLVSIFTTLVETRQTVNRMREMSRFSCDVRVLREGNWQVLDSNDLVPGDVYDVAEPGLLLFPADSVLLSGDAIVNESMLTGESVPVSKVPLTTPSMVGLHAAGTEVTADLAKHFLFSGTRIIRIRGSGSTDKNEVGAKAMVVRTGFNTTKGALVRSMLFPKPMGFKFYRDSFRFIGFLAMVAGVGFTFAAVNFVKIGIAWHTIVIRALDLITVVVPPALPATMSIGISFAINRLRKVGIFCISPNRVIIGGKVDVFCFDKTGTLTAEGLDVLGTRTIDLKAGRFSELHETVDEMPVGAGAKNDADARKMPLLYALATCHSLKVVDGEVIGDPLDVKMFEYTGWTLDEGKDRSAKATTKTGTAKNGKSKLTERPPALVQTVVRPPGGQAFEVEDAIKSGRHAHFLELGVLRTFEFVSSLRRMSVIVKRLKSQSMEVFVKGAPEVMADICDKDTFPADYDDLLSYYTKHGYRVIACAGKSMAGMSWIKAQRMRREQAESGLRFLGLIIFENKLKEGSAPAIEVLRNANIVTKMVTGDNPRTAISVARECGMVGQSAHVFMPTFVEGDQRSARAVVDWSSVDDDRIKLDAYNLQPREVDPHVLDLEEFDFQDYQLALTGDVFRWMIDFAPIETVRRMLIKGTIFARMSPDEKHELVERLQALNYCVGFCGDGANDCGALKAADIGISLSEAEASVAAPFTSNRGDISCVLDTIAEGRAALVTSFNCFSYICLTSLIQFSSVLLMYSIGSSLSDGQFMLADFSALLLSVFSARTGPP